MIEDLGRIFEVGFNLGILAFIKHKNIQNPFGEDYYGDAKQLKLANMVKCLTVKLIDVTDRRIVEDHAIFSLQKGFLSGLNFFREYLAFVCPKIRKAKILYFQCSFSEKNSIGTYVVPNELQRWCRQLGVESIHEDYSAGGEFLNADTLVWIETPQGYRILCVDLSTFGKSQKIKLPDLREIENIRQLLESEKNYRLTKSFFSELKIDSKERDFFLNKELASYLRAYSRKDKETYKLIQAGSYVDSFHRFLLAQGKLKSGDMVRFNIVGYSDRGMSSLSLGMADTEILQTCADIYKNKTNENLLDAHARTVRKLKRNASLSFENGKAFLEKILEAREGGEALHHERLSGFVNPADKIRDGKTLRDLHADMIYEALKGPCPYVFLTGNPGIGKTTALMNFLQDHAGEGFILFYASPRKQVNLDIVQKFRIKDSELLCDDTLITLFSDSKIIEDNGGQRTVRYRKNDRTGTFFENAVAFQDDREQSDEALHQRKSSVRTTRDDTIKVEASATSGVLQSVFEAVHACIDRRVANCIVATASIQALKITSSGDTLQHFRSIFKSASADNGKRVIPAKLREISKRIKHLFVMIDEITGDDGGVQFLSGIHDILFQYGLFKEESGFNTKIIVADASVVAPEIIKCHLTDASTEPNKIYFRLGDAQAQPLTQETFLFKDQNAVVINTNSYPARNLDITYKVFIEAMEGEKPLKQRTLNEQIQNSILSDVLELWSEPDSGQIIVYIQDKQRLGELKGTIKQKRGGFEEFADYVEIHADTPLEKKERIQHCKENVKVVFMTASASRGLSFPKARHILIDVPRFEVERNLMEIIQVIYRGRGGAPELDKMDKELRFYVADTVVYPAENTDQERLVAFQQRAVNILNLLLLLKVSIMTRIYGCGSIARKPCTVIPIGGKSISAVGDPYSSKVGSFLNDLKKEYETNREKKSLKELREALTQIFGKSRIRVRSEGGSRSYLDLLEFNIEQFQDFVRHGLDRLFELGVLEDACVSGGMLIVPVPDMYENYAIGLQEQIRQYANKEMATEIWKVSKNFDHSDKMRSGAKTVLEFINRLRDQPQKSQNLQQSSKRRDQYYAIPLVALLMGEPFRRYFKVGPDEPDGRTFRNILQGHVRAHYPSNNFLPIGADYGEFPFVTFNSFNFTEFRRKMFDESYMLNSTEINVLGLILASTAEE
jgi:hypothetical protein